MKESNREGEIVRNYEKSHFNGFVQSAFFKWLCL
jgi:hypothetical protein